jgi:hypothetical protein
MREIDTTVQHEFDLGPLHVFWPKDAKKTLTKSAIFSSHPSDPVQDALDYNRVILKRGKKKVEELLRKIDPRLVSVEALQTGERSPLIYANIGLPEMIPVTHLGVGFCRLLDIYSELLAGDAQVLLIDEIENGLHHSVLPTVWKGLIAAANELNVQIFATTHSAECIFAADAAVVKNLCNSSGIEGLTIEHCDGRNRLERYIRDLPARSEFSRKEVESLIVLIDAESNSGAAWQQEKDIFLGKAPFFSLCKNYLSNFRLYSRSLHDRECSPTRTAN